MEDEIEIPTRRREPTDLRSLVPGTPEYRRWVDIAADAYPTMRLDTAAKRDAACEDQRDRAERATETRVVAAYRAERLVGGMREYDFTMTVRGTPVFTGGLGSVAVALTDKRRGVARDLVRGFLAHYRARGAVLAVLFPFRPDFYARLGFGNGSRVAQYRMTLGTLPDSPLRATVRALGPSDHAAFAACYERVAARTNGLIRREAWRSGEPLANESLRTFGTFDGAELRGYLTFEVQLGKSGTVNRNALYVHEFLHETPAALAALLGFVRSQSDQFAALILNTYDPDFHIVASDPRNGSDRNLLAPVHHETNTQGLGAMYRIVDVAALIAALEPCTFGQLDATLRIDVDDPFIPANSGAYAIRFRAGGPQAADPAEPADVDLAIGIADLSSLVMGAVRLRSLVAYGRAVLSKPAWLDRLDAAFDAPPPQCLTRF